MAAPAASSPFASLSHPFSILVQFVQLDLQTLSQLDPIFGVSKSSNFEVGVPLSNHRTTVIVRSLLPIFPFDIQHAFTVFRPPTTNK
jgi:hypothetical protein